MRKLFIYLTLKIAYLRNLGFTYWYYVKEGFENANKTVFGGKRHRHNPFRKYYFDSYIDSLYTLLKYDFGPGKFTLGQHNWKLAQSYKNAVYNWHKSSS